jgi:predicted Rossmann fold nucleotide-binding protein DprA/Smf involved in DNA uptake
MHFHFPAWAITALAAIGGFGVLYRELIKPMLQYLKTRWEEYHDKSVWETIREPKYRHSHTSSNEEFYDQGREIPYSLDELRKQHDRSEHSLRRSLSRLEKRGKVKEVAGGWQRKEK